MAPIAHPDATVHLGPDILRASLASYACRVKQANPCRRNFLFPPLRIAALLAGTVHER